MKGDKPTFKQKRFAREYIKNNGNGVKAALEVYDADYENAKSISHDNLRKPVVQQEIKKILEQSGLSLDNVSDKLKDAISQGLNSGKSSVSDALKGIDIALKLHNAYPASRSIKLSYSKHELVASKDQTAVLEDLKSITARATSLISSTD